MISLTEQEVFESLCEAFEIEHGKPSKETSLADLSDDDKRGIVLITTRLNNRLAVKQSGSA